MLTCRLGHKITSIAVFLLIFSLGFAAAYSTILPSVTVRATSTYDVTIWSWDYIEGWLSMPITRDGVQTGFSTSYTFTGLTGTHTFSVPDTDSEGHPFSDWDIGGGAIWTDETVTVSSGGTYTARYRAGYSVTIRCRLQDGGLVSEDVLLDSSSWSDDKTDHTFTDLIGTHTFSVSDSVDDEYVFYRIDSGSVGVYEITASSAGVYTAYFNRKGASPSDGNTALLGIGLPEVLAIVGIVIVAFVAIYFYTRRQSHKLSSKIGAERTAAAVSGGDGTKPGGEPIGETLYKNESEPLIPAARRKGKEELVGSIVCDLYPMNQGLRPTQGFRIQRFDAHGNPLEIVEVEVKAKKVKGRFFVADTVAVKGKWKKGRFEAKSIRNLSTNTDIA